RRKRQSNSKDVTIEMAVYTDAAFTAVFPSEDIQQRIALIIMKYNGVQMEYNRRDMLGYDVKLMIKKIEFFEQNPAWYNDTSDKLGAVLGSFCAGTVDELPYDHMYMHTGLPGLDVTGRAFQNSMCVTKYRCATDKSISFTEYVATAHEIGHNIGMYHDVDRGCTGNNTGNMGGYGAGWSTCNRDDMHTYLQKAKAQCVFEENVPLEVSNEVIGPSKMIGYITLDSSMPGMEYTADEICQKKYGRLFKYREFPLVGSCNIHSCVNHDVTSPYYGQMFKQTYVPGLYCGPSKICFQHGCKDLAVARQYNVTVRAGGWSEWGEWSGCARTCGRGVNFRRRKCSNPSPLNHETCSGNEYDAVVCNQQPCASDAIDNGELLKQRASETCARLIEAGVVNRTNYLPTGERFSYKSYGQCEVLCDTAEGFIRPAFTRFGLMPQGTPCAGEGQEVADTYNWPRRPGYTYMCIDGLCGRFGCDNKYNGAVYDVCGVCGGDGTTCNPIIHTCNTVPGEGNRTTVATLAVGSYNILFNFSWGAMRQNFLEVWTMDNKVALASRVASSWIWNTDGNPIEIAGANWSYSFSSQYLYTKGPTIEPLQIKLYQFRSFENTGISYAFSEAIPDEIPCTFDDDRYPLCGWTAVGWVVTQKYNDTTTLSGIGSFIAANTNSSSINTTSISPSSEPQCLFFRYILYGNMDTKLQISLSKNRSMIWSTEGSADTKWRCGAAEIWAFQSETIEIIAVKEMPNSIIALDDINIRNEVVCSVKACDEYIPTVVTVLPTTSTIPPEPLPDYLPFMLAGIAILIVCILAVIVGLCLSRRRSRKKNRKSSGKLVVLTTPQFNGPKPTDEKYQLQSTYNDEISDSDIRLEVEA
ncbi:hypothetical protein FSP39_007830, partial [Pinctada imbricata]